MKLNSEQKGHTIGNMNGHKRDSGFVSIFSVLIIMSVLTLVAIGFSTITRRAERRTLDNQLFTQAFYAAESGINDARRALLNDPTLEKTDCQGGPSEFDYDFDPALNVGYTCVLINSKLRDIIIDAIPVQGNGSPKVVALESENGDDIEQFDVEWEPAGTAAAASIPTAGSFPNVLKPSTSWGLDLGMLRIDLTPTDDGFVRDTLASESYTLFLYPAADGTTSLVTADGTTAGQGAVALVRCAGPSSPCKATVTLNPGTNNKYVMRLQAQYNNLKATIDNVQNAAGDGLVLQNAQTVVDVTGRANDVFRRIQVRLPIIPGGMLPSYAIQSGDTICKRLLVAPNTVVDPSVSTVPECAVDNPSTPSVPPPAVCAAPRFAGDPNPGGPVALCKKAYWGSSYQGNGDPRPRHEIASAAGVSLSAHRTYWQWSQALNANSSMYDMIEDDFANNRLPFISIKPPDLGPSVSSWQRVGNGIYDGELNTILNRLNSYGKPIWVAFHHEPEGGGSTPGNQADDIGGPTQWKRMQVRVRQRMNALGTTNLAFMPILMSYTWNPASGRDPDEWWEPAADWDAFIVDHFRDNPAGDMFTPAWFSFANWIETRNLSYGTGEWGNRCLQFSCAPTAAAGGLVAAQEMQAFWEWGFSNSRDVVVHSYYDSGLNAPSGTWELRGEHLKKFWEILNDTRVKRIN